MSAAAAPMLLPSFGQIASNAVKRGKLWTVYSTDFPTYSDTNYSATPVTVTVLAGPKWPFMYPNYVVTVTLAYSDACLSSRGCH